VVVTTGPAHRRTRTIIEVQRRGKKVDVLHFDGWLAKMRALGAQHLVCVSVAGYPASVIEKAARIGPTVRLVTLKELQRNSPLLQGALGKWKVGWRHEGTRGYPQIELLVEDRSHPLPTGRPALRFEEPSFRTHAGEVLSLNQIAQRALA